MSRHDPLRENREARSDVQTLMVLFRQKAAYNGFIGDPQEMLDLLHNNWAKSVGEAIVNDTPEENMASDTRREYRIIRRIAGTDPKGA